MSVKRKFAITIGALAGFSLSSAAWSEFVPAETFTDRVTHVRDGDTIIVGDRPIRLDALNCEEKRNDLGKEAKATMAELVSGRQVTCYLDGGKTWDRETGRCSLEGQDLGRIMIERGLCGRCDAFDPWFTYAWSQWKAGPYKGRFPGYCRLF